MNIIFQTDKVDRIVFHYNKEHNQDQTIPTWVVKHKGETHYVHHLDSEVGFKTKESPNNPHTKGSLQFKGVLTIKEEENGETTAHIRTKSET